MSSSNTLIDRGRGAEDDEQLSSVDLHGRGKQSSGASDVRVDLSQDVKGVQNRSAVVDVTHGSQKKPQAVGTEKSVSERVNENETPWSVN